MKTKEELNSLKEEIETLNRKLHELTEEELEQVTDGAYIYNKYDQSTGGTYAGGLVDQYATGTYIESGYPNEYIYDQGH